MANLEENDRSIKDLWRGTGIKFEIAFSKWTSRQSPNIEQVIYYAGGTTHVEYHKLIFCDKHDSETDEKVKKHLVLFVKEVKKIDEITRDDFTQNLHIDMRLLNQGDKIRCRVITYNKNENIPTPDEIDSTLYYEILDDDSIVAGPLVPDTTEGEIIIKR